MSYKKINEALSDISQLRYGNKFTKVSTSSKQENIYGETIEIYSLGEDDLHIKLQLKSDSYGDNLTVNSIQIVKPILKQITDFENV